MKIAGHFGCWRMMIGLALSSASCVNRPTMKVQARCWTGTTNAFVNFPEQEPTNHVWQDLQNKADFGLCFSGGGTRSASTTVGQLRALHQLGVLDKVRYTAAASGGSWALVPYTYHYTPAPIGGGYVESFAYDSIQPTNAGDGLVKTSFYNRRPWIKSPVFNLGDMIDGSEKMAVGVKSHMNRDVGLAWLDLPLIAPPIK